MGTSIRIFSRSRTIEHAYSSNRNTQCRNCSGFGNGAPRCPSADPVSLLCSGNHARSHHLCLNPACPSGGNLKAMPSCCSTSPARCMQCGGEHTALFKTALAARLLQLAGVPPLPPRTYVRSRLATQWTRPPTTITHHPALVQSARSRPPSRRKCHLPGERR